MDELPESDRLFDFPHPREQSELVGHENAERTLLTSYQSGKIHHGWILAGPRGIGKATLAYRMARFVLRHTSPGAPEVRQAESLNVSPEDPVFKRVASGGHSDVFVARRPYDPKSKRLRTEITVDTVRKATQFYTRTAGEGGWRVCIVDAADDMNANAANAVLKVLEEPPDRALFILISHAPRRLLPTIRSRCINLSLNPLAHGDLETVVRRHAGHDDLPPMDDLHSLSRGSPGRALALIRGKGWANFKDFKTLLKDLPQLDHKACATFAERLGARGAEAEFGLFFELLTDWLASSVRDAAISGVHGTPGAQTSPGLHLFAGSRLDAWSDAWQKIQHSIGRTNALNLDRKQTVLQAIHTVEETASLARR